MKLLEARPINIAAASADRASALSLLAEGYSSDDVAVFLGFMDGTDITAILRHEVPAITDDRE
jgi:hypothetical protein